MLLPKISWNPCSVQKSHLVFLQGLSFQRSFPTPAIIWEKKLTLCLSQAQFLTSCFQAGRFHYIPVQAWLTSGTPNSASRVMVWVYQLLEAGYIPVYMYLFGFMVYLSPGLILIVECAGALFYLLCTCSCESRATCEACVEHAWAWWLEVTAHPVRVYSSLLFTAWVFFPQSCRSTTTDPPSYIFVKSFASYWAHKFMLCL